MSSAVKAGPIPIPNTEGGCTITFFHGRSQNGSNLQLEACIDAAHEIINSGFDPIIGWRYVLGL